MIRAKRDMLLYEEYCNGKDILELARKYGVSEYTARIIVSNRQWIEREHGKEYMSNTRTLADKIDTFPLTEAAKQRLYNSLVSMRIDSLEKLKTTAPDILLARRGISKKSVDILRAKRLISTSK